MEKKHIPLSPTLELVTVLSGCLGFSNQSLYTGRGSHILLKKSLTKDCKSSLILVYGTSISEYKIYVMSSLFDFEQKNHGKNSLLFFLIIHFIL
jgi:hypothetical protein